MAFKRSGVRSSLAPPIPKNRPERAVFYCKGAVAQLGWLSEKTPGGVFSSVTSWLPCREREAGATATRLGTQGEWFHSLGESRNYFEFNT